MRIHPSASRAVMALAAGAALVAATSTATTASASTPASPTPPGGGHVSGRHVPALRGAALDRTVPKGVTQRFLNHRKGVGFMKSSPRTLAPAVSGWDGAQHLTWGVTMKGTGVAGGVTTQTVNPNGRLQNPSDPDTVYAPTFLPNAKQGCIEVTTWYNAGSAQIGAWNWCDPKGAYGFQAGVPIDQNFLGTYTNGDSAYRVWQQQTDASSNTWTAYLYNYKTQAWDSLFTSSGTSGLANYPAGFGWNMWEVYTNYNASTGQGWYCGDFTPQRWTSRDLSLLPPGGSWTKADASSTNVDASRTDNGLCNDGRAFRTTDGPAAWEVVPTSGAFPTQRVKLHSATGYNADVDGAQTANGTKVKAEVDNGNDAQRWNLVGQGDGSYEVQSVIATGSALDANTNTASTVDGTSFYTQLWSFGGGANQKWRLNPQPDGTYTVTAYDGGCLTTNGQGNALGYWKCTGATNQKWQITQ